MAIVNIITYNDADFIRGFVYQTADTIPVPINLTGNTMRMGIRQHAVDIAEQLLLTTENGGLTITDAVNGKFKIIITKKQLVENLMEGDYEHSLVRMPVDGSTLRIWSGVLTNNAGPSR